jgi:hypothetical protein
MPRTQIFHFETARLSIVQSAIRELVCKEFPNRPGSGLFADNPIKQAIGPVLDAIHKGAITDADTAIRAYKANRAAQPAIAAEGTAGLTEDCLDLLVHYSIAWLFHDKSKEEEIESEFRDNQCDPGWLTALVAWLDYYWDDKSPHYVPPSNGDPQPIPLPPPASVDGQLRVGILGDWGTGEDEAFAVLDQLMQQHPDLIIHIGDIYYAGTHDECINNFLTPINNARSKYKPVPVYTLPGNHEYYSGGKEFFNILPQINIGIPHAAVQQNSFFCLQNSGWQLEGMDTGYNDHDLLKVDTEVTQLRDDEAAWHQQNLAASGGRKVILLSHHQLFSAFGTIGAATGSGPNYQNPYLLQTLQTWLADGSPNIVAWFWGHEHLLEVYAVPGAQDVNLPILGRCVGHSAFPVFNNLGDYTPLTQSVPLESVSTFPNGYVQTGDDGQVYANGYVLLTLGADAGTAEYYEVNFTGSVSGATSTLLWSEPLPSSSQDTLVTY